MTAACVATRQTARQRARRFTWILLAVFCLIASPVAFADGGYIWIESFLGRAKSGAQQAIILYFENRETLVLRTEYDGELAEFSWLIPTPSPVTATDVQEADEEVFSWLDELTAPRFEVIESDGGGGCGCGTQDGGAPASNGSLDGRGQVEVLDTILTDTYEVNVLSASEAQDLLDWLDQNGFAYPKAAESVLADYLARGWYFLAVRVRPSNLGAEVREALSPLQVTFETEEPVYPLLISSLSSEPETEVLIHFVSDHRVETSNVSSEEVDYQDTGMTDDPVVNYRDWLSARVAARGGRLYFVEYAYRLSGSDCAILNSHLGGAPVDCSNGAFVTRFRSYFSPDSFTDDVYFGQADFDDPFFVIVTVFDNSFTATSRALGCLLFLAAGLVFRKVLRSKRGLHLSRFGFLLAVLILLA
jgi:hypothetical protein